MIASSNSIAQSDCCSDLTDETSRDNLPLTRVFTADCIETMQASMGKADVMRRLILLLVNHNRLDRRHADVVNRQLIQHENYGSSAIGKGLAFPHLRTNVVQIFVGAIGVAPQGIDFESLDHEPTKLVFLTLSPITSRKQHMNLLSRLVSLMRDKAVRMQLHHLIESQKIYQYLSDLDGQSGASAKNRVQISGNETDD